MDGPSRKQLDALENADSPTTEQDSNWDAGFCAVSISKNCRRVTQPNVHLRQIQRREICNSPTSPRTLLSQYPCELPLGRL